MDYEKGSVRARRKSRTGPPAGIRSWILGALCVGLLWWKVTLESLGDLKVWKSSVEVHVQQDWPWSEIPSARDLAWYPCYEKYDCARLDVPLDWLDPSDELRATIAVIRYNATDRADYKGPVFINPGGPGGSGIYFVKRLAPYYQAVVGRNHDIVSFDPRGVGQTIPSIDCFKSAQNGRIWDLQESPVLDAYPGVVYDAYARASAFSQQCAHVISGTGNSAESLADAGSGRFISTASTARDMLEISKKAGQEKLKYWGFSYGTVLGTTFAAMFPDRVERIVNDGNVDVIQYMAGPGTHFVYDTDKVMASFHHFCNIAGPESCSFWEETASAIETRLENLLSSLTKNPIIVPSSRDSNYEIPTIITYSDVRRLIASALYRPLLTFPSLATALAGLESNNGTAFMHMTGRNEGNPFLCDDGNKKPTPELPEVEGSPDASKAILCSDEGFQNGTVDTFVEYVDAAIKTSKSAGATMAGMRLGCAGWSVEAKWRFTGPFVGNTSHPILFVANTADNVTPLISAQRNLKGFPGSALLVSNSYGHTSLSTPSKCLAGHIRAYFQDGTLPGEGTVCDPDLVPFDKWNVSDASAAAGGELEGALRKLMLAPVVRL